MSLSSEQWEKLSRHLDHGLDLPPEARQAWMESLTALDPDLRRTLDELLRKSASGDTDGLLRTLPKFTPDSDGAKSPEGGRRILGSYRLIGELGRGGMGAVWLAERSDGALKRPVALKLPHVLCGEGNQGQFFERFHRERDILATLAHPHIAALYDAGVSADGQPYIALEYVEGTTLTAFSDANRWSVVQRLRLFLSVLAAVQHAHAHLVLHRDLKPSNILVTAEGQVKLLDFGIAKLMTDGEARETELTQLGGRALTLDYASPEQISGEPMSTASDVYSLGVVLYELLSGARPYTLKRDSKGALEDAILSADVDRPSQSVRQEQQASHRSTTVRKLVSQLKGDLDTIVLKALKKLPAERYATADAFAQDMQRYLDGEAVLARPDGASYRAGKFILRHKLPVLASIGVAAALTVGLGVALWQARMARQEAVKSKAVESFLREVFRANTEDQTNPAQGRVRTARDILDAGAKKIDAELNDVPRAKVSVLETLARMYYELGLNDDAVGLYKKRLALAKSALGPQDAEVGLALAELAGAMHSSRFSNEEETVLLEGKSFMDRRRDFRSLDRALLMDKLASLYRAANSAKALACAKEAAQIYRFQRVAFPKEGGNGLVEALYTAGVVYDDQAEFEQALTALSEAISLSRELNGDSNYELPRLYAYQGQAHEGLARFAEAEQSYRRAFEVAKARNGSEHVDTVQTGMRLGGFLVNTSRQKEGLDYLQKALETSIRIRGISDPFHTTQALTAYGNALARNGQVESALTSLSQAVANKRKYQAAPLPLASVLEDQASVMIDLGSYAAAQANLEEASAIRENNGGKSQGGIAARAKFFIATGKAGQALMEVQPWSARETAPISPGQILSIAHLAERQVIANVALAAGDQQRAEALVVPILEQIARSSERRFLKEPEASAALAEGRGYLLAHQPDKALPLLSRAVELRLQVLDPSSPALGDAYVALTECYGSMGDRERARSLLAQARKAFGAHRQLGAHHLRPLADLSRQF